MDAQEYIEKATDPEAWFKKGDELIRDAEALADVFIDRFMDLEHSTDSENKDIQTDSSRLASMNTTEGFLHALAIENILKGYLLRKNPTDAEVSISADGNGNFKDVRLQEIGGAGLTHDLKSLFRRANLPEHLRREENPVIEEPSQIELIEESLDHFTHSIRWKGRYPTPRDLDEQQTWMRGITPEELDEDEMETPLVNIRQTGYIRHTKNLIAYLLPSGYPASHEESPY